MILSCKRFKFPEISENRIKDAADVIDFIYERLFSSGIKNHPDLKSLDSVRRILFSVLDNDYSVWFEEVEK